MQLSIQRHRQKRISIYIWMCWNCFCIQEFPTLGSLLFWVGLFFNSDSLPRRAVLALLWFCIYGLKYNGVTLLFIRFFFHVTNKKCICKRNAALYCSTFKKKKKRNRNRKLWKHHYYVLMSYTGQGISQLDLQDMTS